MVFLHDSLTCEHPHSGSHPRSITPELRLKQILHLLWSESGPRIRDLDSDTFCDQTGVDRDLPPGPRCLGSIGEKAQEHLIQLTGKAGDLRDVAVVLHDFSALAKFRLDQDQRAVDTLVDIRPPEFRLVEPCEVDKVAHGVSDPVTHGREDGIVRGEDLQEAIELSAHWTVVKFLVFLEELLDLRHTPRRHVSRAFQRPDGIVDLVCDTGRQLAQRRHLLRMDQF